MKIREELDLFISSGISPVIILDDLSGSAVADQGFPRDAWGEVVSPAGGVGTNAQTIVAGIADSTLLFKLSSAIVQKPTDGQVGILIGQGISGVTELFVKGYSDVRVFPDTPKMFMGENTPLTASIDGALLGSVEVEALVSLTIPLDMVLGGTTFVNIVNLDTNEALITTYRWTEYLLEDF